MMKKEKETTNKEEEMSRRLRTVLDRHSSLRRRSRLESVSKTGSHNISIQTVEKGSSNQTDDT
jgi:hypothetical protein